jgi:hypothetical protein
MAGCALDRARRNSMLDVLVFGGAAAILMFIAYERLTNRI